MKTILKYLILFLIINQGCTNQKAEVQNSLISNDTLIIQTYKQKGSGLLLGLGVSSKDFKDITLDFPYSINIPENIQNVKRTQMASDFRAKNKYYIDIILGEMSEEQVFIIDENNNNDLTDDSIRLVKPINWDTEEDLVECLYSVSKQNEIIQDTTWLRIGLSFDDVFRCGKCEHRIAKLSIDKEKYEIGIAAPYSGDFTYNFAPEIALLSNNQLIKDTLYKRDIIKQGEILKLNDSFYRFDTISKYGDSLVIVKENNFEELVGTQVGMLAPDFNCISVTGDTIKSSKLHDKILIIANSCGCGGDKESTEAYYEILHEYDSKVHVLRLDSKINKDVKGQHIDVDNKFNQSIYNSYRNVYCSRTCYVINEDNRILDKFPVIDWHQHLSKIVHLKN